MRVGQNKANIAQAVLNGIRDLLSLDELKRLFWQELNYERENKSLSQGCTGQGGGGGMSEFCQVIDSLRSPTTSNGWHWQAKRVNARRREPAP